MLWLVKSHLKPSHNGNDDLQKLKKTEVKSWRPSNYNKTCAHIAMNANG